MSSHDNQDGQLVATSFESGILTITLNETRNGNALTIAMTEALSDELEAVKRRNDVRCVLLRSAGKPIDGVELRIEGG